MRIRHYAMMTVLSLMTFGLVAVAPAQDSSQQNRSQQDQQNRDQQDRDEQNQQQRDQQSQQRQQQSQQRRQAPQGQRQQQGQQGQLRLQPAGWVRVATDYDNDGRFDAVETMYFFDLQRARQSSQARARDEASGRQMAQQGRTQQGRMQQGRMPQARMQGRSGQGQRQGQRQGQQDTIQGQIKNIRRVKLAGMDGQNVVARVETNDGRTAKVCLGPESNLSQLDLQDGDRITVTGRRGHINDKSMMIASKVQAGGNEVSISMPSGRHLKRAAGKITSLRQAKFRGRDQQYTVAKVQMSDGRQETVNLGPQSKLQELDLQQGDQVSLLVRPGRINGEPAMIAEQVRANGTLVELERPQSASRFQGQNTRRR